MNNRYFDHRRVNGIYGRKNTWAGIAVSFCSIIFLTACGGGGGGGSTPPPTHTISGTVFAAAGNAIDSDVNDRNTTPVSNNDFDAAQNIASPAVVGGYVNVAGAGSAGNSQAAGDANDYYRVALTSGQSVRFSLPAGITADIELYLFDSDRNQMDALVGVERMGLLNIAASGIYFLEVRAVAGASSYKLIIGDEAALTVAASGFSLASEFVPGQAIVRWKAAAAPTAAAGRLAMTTAATVGAGRFHLMQFDTREQVNAVFERLNLGTARMAAQAMPAADAQVQRKYETLKIIQALRRRDDVEIAEPNYIRHAMLTPTDPFFNRQWHYNNISLPGLSGAWEITTGDPGVVVAVIDTGVLLNHPDLSDQLVAGYDFISDPTIANDGDGRDADPDDPGDGLNNNSSFHGTHVAGTVVAAMNNSVDGLGVGGTGVAPGAKVMPVRVLGVGGGTDADIIDGILFAANRLSEGPAPAQPADIINMSLGGPASSAALDAAILEVREQAGVIIVAAAGNVSSSQPEYPAASPGVISVAATDFNDQRALYTNFGTSVDVAAPGGDIGVNLDGIGDDDGVFSTGGSDETGTIEAIYVSAQGTSMSSPHMAGVAALMESVRAGGLTPDELDAYLASEAITDTLNDSGLGAGLINASKAVTEAGVAASPTALQATPNALNFDNATGSAVLELVKLGSDALRVTLLDADASWLSVSAQTVDADNLGSYLIGVDRTGLSGGIYTATIEITSSINSVQVPVRMEVLPDTGADAGLQYILVVDADSFTLIDRQPMTFTGSGTYTFSITDLETGNYFLLTGTDLDNDGLSLDAGEAFGAFPAATQFSALTVNSDVQGIDFISGFSLDPFVTANQIHSATVE